MAAAERERAGPAVIYEKKDGYPYAEGQHPAGKNLEAQHRWDTAMDLVKEPPDEEDKKMRQQQMADKRLIQAHGGFEDWVYEGGNLVKELIDVLEEESFGLHQMIEAARESAKSLDDKQWERFQTVPRRCVHACDKEVIGALFSATEPQWRTLLTAPKKGGTCLFFHIGTEPVSLPIAELLTKLGWYGINVSPDAPMSGNEDRIQHVGLDPFEEQDEIEILKLQVAKNSLVPKPALFQLTFADVVWDPDALEGNDDEASAWKRLDSNSDGSVSRKEFKMAVRCGIVPKGVKFKQFDTDGNGSISKDEFMEATKIGLMGEEAKASAEVKSAKPKPPQNQTGYGLLGVTWRKDVRNRLRIMRNMVSVALQRLENQGTLVICWHGIPHHPALLFLTAQLRPVFLRVHVLVPEGTKSWETWIMAASFKRSDAEEVASKGGGGFMFKNFINNAYRCSDLDDALLWTLTAESLFEEYRLGGGERTIAKGYNELWSAYAAKYRELAKDFGSTVTTEDTKKKRPAKRVADKEPTAKAKPKPKPKTPEVKPGTPGEKPGTAGTTGDKSDMSGVSPPSTADAGANGSGTLPPVPGASPDGAKSKGKAKAKARVTSKGRCGLSADDFALISSQSSTQRWVPKKSALATRSLPNLSCTFGCAPGAKNESDRSEWKLAETNPLIRRAFDHLEKKSKVVERINRVDIEWAMKMTSTDKFMESDEGMRFPDCCISVPQDMDDQEKAQKNEAKKGSKEKPGVSGKQDKTAKR